ncbi:DUF3732 domain-containing protein [Chryseobacterium profundimaris]|uniref:Rad50/SbcC-type AAA domain-containing protein n=1 Tax=Chryseobacterium profundimaris TaxID=1387275 RepID=A0ABY1NTF8_9FLAO|nr:DUF3732 domain-containing protein [Chryseobacterium profundimaris]SMP17491.1 Protein of unknown function [Chryseobacterium profundimaris]
MNFNINKIILWLKNGKIRELEFKPNKVNLITGGSHTGKSAIIEIVDYCLFSSKSRISESMINENVLWYGINISVNDKKYTIARESLSKGKVSDNYYFSSFGETPSVVTTNNSEIALKSILETEFKIDRDAKFPTSYGSNYIKAGSKISLRYFLMFNTISGNIIENDEGVFFDKQNEIRYREALPRIFDLALGIETVENILKSEKKAELENLLSKVLRKKNAISSKASDFHKERIEILQKAKEYNVVRHDTNADEIIPEITKAIQGLENEPTTDSEREKLKSSFYSIQRKIRNLKKFSSEYNTYKNSLKILDDSLKPIEFLKEKDSEIIKTSIFERILTSYTKDLTKIRKSYSNNTPIDRQVNDNIKDLEKELEITKSKLDLLPSENKSFENEKEKYFFLGQMKSKLEIFSVDSLPMSTSYEEEIKALQSIIEQLIVENTEKKRELTIKLIEEIIGEYISESGEALANYSTYQPVFDYKNKTLLLRRPKTSYIENVGSSSNHMFLHLFFSLAMHEVIFQNQSPFVAPFLIIDQPSRPYYGTNGQRKADDPKSDDYKIKKAFKLLDSFIETRKKNNGNFQMIVLEHIPTEMVSDLKNIYIVDEFFDGNALIPKSYIE